MLATAEFRRAAECSACHADLSGDDLPTRIKHIFACRAHTVQQVMVVAAAAAESAAEQHAAAEDAAKQPALPMQPPMLMQLPMRTPGQTPAVARTVLPLSLIHI